MLGTDLQAILVIERQVFSNPWPPEAFEIQAHCKSYVLLDDDILIGYIMYHVVLDEAMIVNFGIAPERQNMGLGNQLLLHTMHLMHSASIHNIYLDVRESNTSARHLYTKHGFEVIGKRRNYYSHPEEDAIVMCRSAFGDSE